MDNHKHDINDAICDFMRQKKQKPLKILETNQEFGNGTERYSKCGCVISFEVNKEKYESASRRFLRAYSLDACISNLNGFCETAAIAGTKRYPIIMPPKPLDATHGADYLNSHCCKFDIIDVDPYGSPKEFVPGVLPLLEDESFLFVTTGVMYNVRWHAQETLSEYKVQADDKLKPTRSFFKKDNALILGDWVIETALGSGVALFPIFIYDYWTGYSGVQRMGFQAKPRASPNAQALSLQQLGKDPFLGIRIMKCAYKRDDNFAWRFSEYEPKEFKEYIKSRIAHIEKQLKR